MTQETEKFKDKGVDPGFLVAKGRFRGETKEERDSQEKTHRTKLANAIYMAINNHGYATIRAIGTNAMANAVRSITVATDRCRLKGVHLAWESVTEKGNLGPIRDKEHVKDVIAYCFRLTDWKQGKEMENKNVGTT